MTTGSSKDERNSHEFEIDSDLPEEDQAVAKGGVACPFPWRLHECLASIEKEGLEHVASWKPHGRAFSVHKPEEFVEEIMPRFFNQSKFASFQRQLNLYGFSRLNHGKDKGAYYSLFFVRGQRSLVRQMVRRKIKGNKVRRALHAWEEPNFYLPEWVDHFEASEPVALKHRRFAPLCGPPATLKFVEHPQHSSSVQPLTTTSTTSDMITSSTTATPPSPTWPSSRPLSLTRAITNEDFGAMGLLDGCFPIVEAHDDELLEPTPLREDLVGHHAASGGDSIPSFKLVDPVRNIFLLL